MCVQKYIRVLTGKRDKKFTMYTAQQWNRLPRETAQSPFLEVTKTQLDKALSNLD